MSGKPRKLKAPLKENEFYCVSCRGRVKVDKDDMCVQMLKNKRSSDGKVPALRARCDCKTNLTKFVKRADVKELVDEYGKC